MHVEEVYPGMIVNVALPWGERETSVTLCLARVVVVRPEPRMPYNGVRIMPVTVEWIGTPNIPGGHSRYNTFSADRLFPVNRGGGDDEDPNGVWGWML